MDDFDDLTGDLGTLLTAGAPLATAAITGTPAKAATPAAATVGPASTTNTTLIIGIVVGAVVLIGGAFMLLRK